MISTAGASALAEPTAADKALAETLFNDAQRLVKEGKYAEACPKYAESLRRDSGLGTMLYLADCYEKNGQTASAWGQFREAASIAKNTGQGDREKKATDRAAALEPKLLRLSITVSPEVEHIAGLEVKRDGEAITKALWGTAMPLDPGDHVVEASAPGKKKWSTTAKLVEGGTGSITVQIPMLESEPAKVEPPKVEPPKGEPPKGEPPKGEPPKGATGAGLAPGQVVGLAAMGLGVVGLGAGTALGIIALNKNAASNDPNADNCRPNNTCTTAGRKLRQGAINMATGSTVSLITGGVLVAGGLVTVLVLRSPKAAPKSGLQVNPVIGARGGGLWLQGGF